VSRIVRRPIAVSRWCDGEPLAFQDQEVVRVIVDVIDRWFEMGCWWLGEGERKMMRVWTEDGGLMDLEEDAGQWFIYKVWD